jgi:FAD/FMN-containing dehydrogenase
MKSSMRAPSDTLVNQLHDIVGDSGLIVGPEAAARSCDPFRAVPPKAEFIVRPGSTAEVSRLLALCHACGQRLVIHGGRTGVVGGTYADRDEIVLSLERMARIEDIDPVGLTAVVQAGITLAGLQDALEPHRLSYPIDLGSKGSATIGGTIATNAGGNRVVRWGMTRHNVLGLEVVLSDGTIVSAMNRLLKNNTGYDIKQWFMGAEGTLGVTTRAVLKLVPTPRTQYAALIALADFPAVLSLLQSARQLPILSAFEVMWDDYYALVAGSDSDRSPLPVGFPYYALVELMGYDEQVDGHSFESLLQHAQDSHLAADAVIASSGKQVAALWRVREASEIIVRELWPFVTFDVSIDIRNAESFVSRVRTALRETFGSIRTATFGHLGDGNLHLGVHAGQETLGKLLDIERCVYAVVKQFGGALTAEHGIGRFKREFLPDHVAPGALEVMRRICSALAPQRLLNHNVLL